ncbi:FAD binding protein [Nitzschia inconspicua]|uniref:FAD binding protein n=1 Tax=Nitzschia inconspicua TaxID=303405 RepID=A0A9K3Q6Z7_9STRA|nr:FAD binding protein [Nitzschia inconspicua]
MDSYQNFSASRHVATSFRDVEESLPLSTRISRRQWFAIIALVLIGASATFFFRWSLVVSTINSDGSITLVERNQRIWEALQQLQSDIDGTVYFRHDDNATGAFAQASRVYYASAAQGDQAPIAVIEVANEADVQKSVVVLSHLRMTYELPFRIRSGGHNKAGFSTVSEGAVLSLKNMNRLTVKLNDHNNSSVAVVRMEPAVLVRQFLSEVLAKHGYAGVVGYCPTVAEAGFILGGGLGLQSRLYGLGLDNVLGMRVVMADGSVRHVSKDSQDSTDIDLFWALRGAGGGSFGVVTELEYQIHKASDKIMFVSVVLQSASDMASFLHRLGQEEHTVPGNLMVMHDQIDAVRLMWSGKNDNDMDRAGLYISDLLDDLLPAQTPRSFDVTEALWTNVFLDESDQWSSDVYAVRCWYGFLYPENNTHAVWQDIMKFISAGVHNSSGFLLPDIEFWGGAIQDTLSNATAFPHRSAVFNVGVLLTIPNDTPDAAVVFQTEVNKVNGWWPHVANYLTGSYVNYPTNTLMQENYAHAHWGNNLPRLVDIKRRVDLQNVFEFPMSVPLNL